MSHDWISSAEADASLREPMHLRERIGLLDRLEWLGESSAEPALRARAEALRCELEDINRRFYTALRQGIRVGEHVFAPWIDTLEPTPAGDGYDYRDDLLSGVLALDEPDEVAPLPPEMVFYQPTPARHVFELIRRARLNEHDVVMDFGSGLGIVPLVVAATTAARAIGIEREATYVDAARRCASRLGLARLSFECGDARDADVSAATLFYFYTPFTGTVMRKVLETLRREAARRPLRIASFGPCTEVIADEPWLRAEATVSRDRLALFHAG